ncbi:interleukin-21 [Embiotoca jacksoni]|uniref:interleukin-21 n=1 Tax=Embiotoca jacksoni TaxID=100190 RepID=UPI003704A05A
MKLVLFCLFAVCCCSPASTTRTSERRKLEEVLKQLNSVKESLQHNEQMVNTPPENIEDCCCLSALQCFRVTLQFQFNATERKQMKLSKSLQHPLTMRGLDFCNDRNSASSCQTCDSHPKQKGKEFFNRLESLIQRARTKLSMN